MHLIFAVQLAFASEPESSEPIPTGIHLYEEYRAEKKALATAEATKKSVSRVADALRTAPADDKEWAAQIESAASELAEALTALDDAHWRESDTVGADVAERVKRSSRILLEAGPPPSAIAVDTELAWSDDVELRRLNAQFWNASYFGDGEEGVVLRWVGSLHDELSPAWAKEDYQSWHALHDPDLSDLPTEGAAPSYDGFADMVTNELASQTAEVARLRARVDDLGAVMGSASAQSTWTSGLILGMIVLLAVIVLGTVGARYGLAKERVPGNLIDDKTLIEYGGMSFLILAVIILSSGGKISTDTVGPLLGTIAGYIFGKSFAAIRPNQNGDDT